MVLYGGAQILCANSVSNSLHTLCDSVSNSLLRLGIGLCVSQYLLDFLGEGGFIHLYLGALQLVNKRADSVGGLLAFFGKSISHAALNSRKVNPFLKVNHFLFHNERVLIG